MIYLDTSFLTPLFREEPASRPVEKFLSTMSPGTLAISQWTRVEFASVIARDVRMNVLDAATARRLIEAFADLANDALQVLVPLAADFELATAFVTQFTTQLRGPDALHLAIARNNSVDEILSLDAGMILAAKKLKLKARRGIRI